MFVLVIQHRKKSGTPDWDFAAKSIVLWGIGYMGMWMTKWAFAAVVLRRNIMPYVHDSITLHLGLSDQLSLPQLWRKSLWMNVEKLLTFNYERQVKLRTIRDGFRHLWYIVRA